MRAAPGAELELQALSRERFVSAVAGYRASAAAGDVMVRTRLEEPRPSP